MGCAFFIRIALLPHHLHSAEGGSGAMEITLELWKKLIKAEVFMLNTTVRQRRGLILRIHGI